MSQTGEARDVLVACASRLYGVMHDAATAYGKAHSDLAKSSDLAGAMAAMVDLILAAERLKTCAEESEKTLRATLAEEMTDDTIYRDHHTAHRQRAPQYVEILDAIAVPPDLMTEPKPPVPDKTKIGVRLRQVGKPLPYARLMGNQPWVLVIKARKDT